MGVKEFLKRVNAGCRSNYIGKVVPENGRNCSESTITKRVECFYPGMLQQDFSN